MALTLIFPIGTNIVLTKEIPFLIATIITPQLLASNKKITAIEKIVDASTSNNKLTTPESLKEGLFYSDLTNLSKACRLAGLPSLMSVIKMKETNLSEWVLYENAIENHFPKLQYKLQPHSKTVLEITTEQHTEYLEEAIENGKAIVHDCITHIPLKRAIGLTTIEKSYMTIDALEQYVAKFNLKVFVGNETGYKNSINAHNNISHLKKISAIKQQDNAILKWLLDSKYNPKAIPMVKNGLSGIKKECRDVLQLSSLFSSKSVFDNAWQRLRDNGEIIDAK